MGRNGAPESSPARWALASKDRMSSATLLLQVSRYFCPHFSSPRKTASRFYQEKELQDFHREVDTVRTGRGAVQPWL